MSSYNKFMLVILAILALTSKSFAQECPKTVHVSNQGWFTTDVTYYDCNGHKKTERLLKGQERELDSGVGPEDAVVFYTWPRGGKDTLGWHPVNKPGLKFMCHGTSPQTLGGNGKCDPS